MVTGSSRSLLSSDGPLTTMNSKFLPWWLALLAAGAGTGLAELPHFENATITVVGDAGQNME
jgi:hypothetical protein